MQQINTDDILTSGMGDVMTRNCAILNEGVDTDTSALDKQPCKPSCVDAAVQAVCDTADALCEPVHNLQPTYSKTQKKLTVDKPTLISITPRKIYHPAVINACLSMHGKHPSDLNDDEVNKFNLYIQWKRERGEPIETDIIHCPSDLRACLHCGHPT